MNKLRPNKLSESGVTLIVLLVTIVLIVILAGVVIKAMSGDEGMLKVAGTAAKNYKVEARKESLDMAMQAAIIENAILRKNWNTKRNGRNDK